MREYNFICMFCGKRSNKCLKYIVYQYLGRGKMDKAFRAFCKDECLIKYYEQGVKRT